TTCALTSALKQCMWSPATIGVAQYCPSSRSSHLIAPSAALPQFSTARLSVKTLSPWTTALADPGLSLLVVQSSFGLPLSGNSKAETPPDSGTNNLPFAATVE